MPMTTVAAVVCYSHLERDFLGAVLRECRHFAREVVVVYGSRYFDLTPQPPPAEHVVRAFPDVKFLQHDTHDHPGMRNRAAYWINSMRWAGVQASTSETVLFLDADEVPEGRRVAAFLAAHPPGSLPPLKFANWWYMRHPWLRCEAVEDSIILVPRAGLTAALVLGAEAERDSLVGGAPRRRVVDGARTPMFHHYSWVRSADDLRRKVATWGHAEDRDWLTPLNAELGTPVRRESGHHTDAIFGRRYTVVEPYAG